MHAANQPDREKSNLPAELSAPARRALALAGCTRLEHVAQMTEAEVAELHGIGPRALEALHRAFAASGLSFAGEEQGNS